MVNEFAFKGPFLKLGQNIGLLVGAVVFGVGSDVWGRKYVSFKNFSILRYTYRFYPTQVVFQSDTLHYWCFCPFRWSFAGFDHVMLLRRFMEYRRRW